MNRSQTGMIDRAALYLLAFLASYVLILATLPVPQRPVAAEAPPGGDFAVVDGTVFDGERFLPHRDVWVEAGRIRAFGRRLDLPDELPRVDGRGRTLLPGLIDGHVHAFGDVRSDALRFGVTTVLDQFTALSMAGDYRTDREQQGHDGQADLFSAGMLATAPGGHGTQYGMTVDTLTDPAQASAWVRARKAEGSDWIKIVIEDGSHYDFETATLAPELVAAVVAAAHAEGLLAVAHVSRLAEALRALDAGVDGLVHVWTDALIEPADAQRLADAEVFVIPTLAVISSVAGVPDSVALAGKLPDGLLSKMQRDTLAGRFPVTKREGLDVAVENVRRLAAAGVTLLAGTDAPNPGTASGLSMHAELRLLGRAGLTPAELLAAATRIPARAFGIEDRGAIAEGQLADLLLVDGDLGADGTSTAILTVWKDGEPVVRELSAEALAATIATAPDETLIADFEDGNSASFGLGWYPSTDEIRAGESLAEMIVQDGYLRVIGEVKAGFPFPWAGTIWFPGAEPMTPVDFGGRETLRFRARGDGRRYTVMLFGETMGSGPPPSRFFTAGEAWETFEMPLADFGTGDVISGLSFVAQLPHGPFELDLDDIEIR